MTPNSHSFDVSRTPCLSLAMALALLLLGLDAGRAATLRVEKAGGTGVYTNINQAISAARSGDTINIGPGNYQEAVVVTKDLTLNGAGPQYTQISPASGRAVYVNQSVSATLFAVTLSSADTHAVEASFQASLTMRNCVIAGAFIYGVAHYSNDSNQAGLGSALAMDHCTILNCDQFGVYWHCYANQTGSVVIRNSVLALNNRRAGDYNVYTSSKTWDVGQTLLNGKTYYVNSSSSGIPGFLTGDPKFVDPKGGNYLLGDGSAARDRGPAILADQDPDGSLSDLGAYGGPLARSFWPYPVGGPMIRDMSVSPGAVVQGGKITIKATATTR